MHLQSLLLSITSVVFLEHASAPDPSLVKALPPFWDSLPQSPPPARGFAPGRARYLALAPQHSTFSQTPRPHACGPLTSAPPNHPDPPALSSKLSRPVRRPPSPSPGLPQCCASPRSAPTTTLSPAVLQHSASSSGARTSSGHPCIWAPSTRLVIAHAQSAKAGWMDG